jgi:CAAX prenyl protease-like protein
MGPRPDPRREDPSASAVSDIFPYVAPLFAYIGLSALETYLPRVDGEPSPAWYPLAYAAKLTIVVLVAWWYRATWRDFRPAPTWRALVLAIVTGLVVWGLWIGLEGRYPMFAILGKRVGFNTDRLAPGMRWAFLSVRMLGLVVVVPLVEELFWRSFLMRWLIDPDNWWKVPVGQVTLLAAGATSAAFALAHPEWLPALLTGLLWAALLWRTSSLAACAVSHATANLALGLYVIATGDWKYW